jgi:hypothetical protein
MALPPVDKTQDQTAALILAVILFLVFSGMAAALITRTVQQDATAWVGAGLVGLGSFLFAFWAWLLDDVPDFRWAERIGGDLLLPGFAVFFAFGGLATFAAAVV